MPRKIPSDISFDDAEDEIHFTRACLKADPDATDLLGETDDWQGLVDAGRMADRAARATVAEADALRIVSNARLDGECTHFGDELLLAVGKDRTSSRWKKFFSVAVNRFIRQALGKQVQSVKGWLTGTDPVLEKHRAALTTWSTAADEALVKTRATALVRGTARQQREEMAESLTRERDGLYEMLAARARERGLPRAWPATFFRVEERASAGASDSEETDAGAAPAGGGASEGSGAAGG